jgi:tetratricopeptide (TPR) repeat protein
MDLKGRAVALYGRFSAGVRERLAADIVRAGGQVARDLTRRSDILVVGALAAPLIGSGALRQRLRDARERGLPAFSEHAFVDDLAGARVAEEATLPVAAARGQTLLTFADLELLAVFDLILLQGDRCRFGDAGAIRTAAELIGQGRSWADVVAILTRARDLSPEGRHKIVLTPSGAAALQWDNGVTTLEGQGYLALDEDHPSLEDLFQAAAICEAVGEYPEALRLYDQCARGDKNDAIAPYNYANIRMAQGVHDEAILAYQRSLSRDPAFVEARYNLAQALEASGKQAEAAVELARVLESDPSHPDALFNLAQLRMKAGELHEAKTLYESYLALGPSDEWAVVARKAILYCAAQLLI